MARRYSTNGSITSAATKTICSVGATTVRPKIYDIVLSSNATPADNASEWQLQRYIAAGTSTAITPTPLDSGDPPCISVSGKNHTVEPTYTAATILLDFSFNQRATFRWVAAPGSELVGPATAANGLGLQCAAIGGAGVAVQATILFEE